MEWDFGYTSQTYIGNSFVIFSKETLINAISLLTKCGTILDIESRIVTHYNMEIIDYSSSHFCITIVHHVKVSVQEPTVIFYYELAIVVECRIMCTELHGAGSVLTIVNPRNILLRDVGFTGNIHVSF